MKPLPSITDRDASIRDEAKGGFSLAGLEDLLQDCIGQPAWRERADKSHAYYDMGKQLSVEQELKVRRDWGIEPTQTNLIHGVINGVLGLEAKGRTDVRLAADTDDYADLCDVFSARMKEAQREAYVDMAVSNAYAGEVKGGIGWVEVSRSNDPLDYPYRVTDIHRNEIWYDWRSKQIGLQDARWLVRKRWEDLDEAIALMPDKEDILRHVTGGWDLLALPDDETVRILRSWTNERRSRVLADEWLDTTRRRIKFFEVWYRVPAEVVVMQVAPTRRIVYDQNNPMHREAVARGKVKLSKSVTRQVRMALFAGPVRLLDVGTTRRHFPYVPFFGFRDDEDRSPYGMIEGMISPQDEYNERRQMVRWMLKARQVWVDRDALDEDYNTLADFRSEVMRPDMMTVLNPSRRNKDGIRVGNDLSLQKEQFEVMQDAKQLVQDVPKVYGSMLGSAPSGVTSGIANSVLIEQGITAMGEMNDNYRFARRLVFEQLLDLIVEDHLDPNTQVTLGTGATKRTIVLNSQDERGAPVNQVKYAPIKVGLEDVPASPAFRAQEQEQVAKILQALQGNPAAVNLLAPAYIEGSSLPNRKELADDLRRATGQPVAGDRDAQQQAQQKAQQLAQVNMQLAVSERQANVAKVAADTRLAQAKAEQLDGQSMLAARAQALTESQALNQPEQPETEDQLIERAISGAMGAALPQQPQQPPPQQFNQPAPIPA